MIEVKLLSITAKAEALIEECGRTAYLSFSKKNENSKEKFIKMIIRSGHLAVLEHASATFRIKGGSRSFTHQLVRHRLAAFTQQSQRYVSENNFSYVIPDAINNDPEIKSMYEEHMENVRKFYKTLLDNGVKKEDARFVLPNAVESEIVMTANFREWRHILEIRGDIHAQWEIRRIAIEILKILKEKAPSYFFDMYIDEDQIKSDQSGKH